MVPAFLAVFLAILGMSPPAFAHRVSLSSLKLEFHEDRAQSLWTISSRDLHHVATPRDADGDGRSTTYDLVVQGSTIQEFFQRHVQVHVDGRPCRYEPGSVDLGRRGQLRLNGRYGCHHPPGLLEVHCAFHQAISERHRMVSAISFTNRPESNQWHTFNYTTPVWSHDAGTNVDYLMEQFRRFGVLGIEHIFTGYDHLAFLVGLLLLGGGVRRLVLVVTSFTVAHSITLALAALGHLTLPSFIVEPAIAASIAYVGAENLLVREGRRRWLIAFLFGLIHGFGFAGILQEMGLPPGALAMSLVSFNLGVELGQVCIVVALLGAAAVLGRVLAGSRFSPDRWYRPWGIRTLSIPIIIAGVYWFLERTLLV